MRITHHAVVPVTFAIAALAAGAGPARATVVDKSQFTFQESTDEDLCGIAVRHDFAISGTQRIRAGKHKLDQAFFGKTTSKFTDTFTNLANGRSFSIEGRVNDKDVKATPLGGNVFRFVTQESGTIVLRDASGAVRLRDSGLIRSEIVFDTLGDSQPGGNVLDEQVTRISGPHPLFGLDDAAFCGVATDLLTS